MRRMRKKLVALVLGVCWNRIIVADLEHRQCESGRTAHRGLECDCDSTGRG